jgi:hypothetical protein
MWLSLSRCVGEIAVNRRSRRRQGGQRQRTEDDANQHQQRDLLHRPKRWNVVCVEQILRGKVPGNPG